VFLLARQRAATRDKATQRNAIVEMLFNS